MESIIKKAREVGTSAGVLLPRKWLDKQVIVSLFEPSKKSILQDVTEYLFKYNLNEEAKGIYLFGSYARGDFDLHSDIDILIITHNLNKLINQDNYQMILVSENSFSKNLVNSLNYLSTKKFLLEIKKILEINKETIDLCRDNKINIPDGTVYSLVLRLRELYLIKCLLSNKLYSKEEFLKFVGDKAYLAYLRVKENKKELDNIPLNEVRDIIEASEKWLKELRD